MLLLFQHRKSTLPIVLWCDSLTTGDRLKFRLTESFHNSNTMPKSNMQTHGAVIVQGYTVIRVKFSERSKACHHIYVKEHVVRGNNSHKPKDRTLFAIGVPPYCDEECIKRLFSSCGKVESVFLHKSPTNEAPVTETSSYFPLTDSLKGFKVAYVVFKKSQSISRAKAMEFDHPVTLSDSSHPILTGLRKWCKEYEDQIINPKFLQDEINTYMKEFDEKLEKEVEEAKAKEGVADDEGWVTVTRHGKNKGAPRTEVHEKRVTAKERKRRKEKELLNFYSFQTRESKMEHINQLRQKFEEDKQKIALMKQARKFKPY